MDINEEAFAGLLERFSNDPEQSAKRYVEVQSRLTRYFTFHGGSPPEGLAYETLNRVSVKIIEGELINNVDRYIWGTARNVLKESRRRQKKIGPIEDSPSDPSFVTRSPEDELIGIVNDRQEKMRLKCMRECLDKLPHEQYRLMQEFQRGKKKARIQNRIKLAEKLGIRRGALRLRVHQIRTRLRECLDKCVRRHCVP